MTSLEVDMMRAKDLVKGALLGFTRDWNAHLKAEREFNNSDAEYLEFARSGKLADQRNYFDYIIKQIRTMDISDDTYNKVSDFKDRMNYIIEHYHDQGYDFWGREYPDSIPNRFDALLKDIKDMQKNLDDYFKGN